MGTTPTDSALQVWLELQCQMIAGAEAGRVVIGQSEHAARAQVANWPKDQPPHPRLTATLSAAQEQGRLVAQTPSGDLPARETFTELALPILAGKRVVGAFGVRAKGLPESEIKALAGLLGHGIRGLALLLDVQERQQRLGDRLSLAGSLLDHQDRKEASHALTEELARSLGCSRVAIGSLHGASIRMDALSTSLRFKEESDGVRELRDAMQEAVDEDVAISLPSRDRSPVHSIQAHERLLKREDVVAVATFPLVAHGSAFGAMTFEWPRGRTAKGVLGRAREAATLCGPILALMQRADASVFDRFRSRLSDWRAQHFGANARLARGVLAGIAGLLFVLAIAPGSYRISAQASLEGRIQRALVAGVDGYVSEANARAGDVVREGDVLARLDDRDLRLERRKKASERAQLEKQYREAFAGRDRTQVSLFQARLEQAAAELALVEEQLGRTQVIAPFDGIVLEGDLDRSLGSPVELGGVLFEMAPLDGYRIIIEVDGRDIADVEKGQTGRLTLEALPDQSLPLVVDRVTPVSIQEDGRSFFRVEAVLETPFRPLIPGMEGIAKIDAGTRRLLWIWTHELLDWLRLATWSYLP